MIRQGDLLFVSVEDIPEATEREDGIVAEGELTGHHHRIRSRAMGALMIAGVAAYIKALRDTHIDHPEHSTVVLPPGNWQVIRQREYEPEGWRRVQD
jgi:hypothetical protein